MYYSFFIQTDYKYKSCLLPIKTGRGEFEHFYFCFVCDYNKLPWLLISSGWGPLGRFEQFNEDFMIELFVLIFSNTSTPFDCFQNIHFVSLKIVSKDLS